jgi:serine-type D-Ala-D-Ala carboxypeptidase (penicillin-binding protein 5/6)
MKKKIVIVLLLCSLLVSCSNSSDSTLYYTPYKNANNFTTDESRECLYAEPFATNLCVIPTDSKIKKDNKLTTLSALMVDITSNELIYNHNVYKRLYPASITKIFTTLVAFKYADLKDKVTISKNAANVTEPGAQLCGFKENDVIELEDLLTAFLIYSGNDAGVAIAEHVAGSVEAFSKLMNEESKKLGAVDSNFVNPHGLHDDKHYTTAYDIYIVFNELLKNDTFIDIIHKSSCKIVYNDSNGNKVERHFNSTNRFLTGRAEAPKGLNVIGGKTGSTNEAGTCLSLYSIDKKNEHGYISIILKAQNGNDLYSQMDHLLTLRNQ